MGERWGGRANGCKYIKIMNLHDLVEGRGLRGVEKDCIRCGLGVGEGVYTSRYTGGGRVPGWTWEPLLPGGSAPKRMVRAEVDS